MIATIWRSRVLPAAVDAFERVHGPHGDRAQRFARAGDHAGTELLRCEGAPVCLSTDRWHNAAAHQYAGTGLAAEYAALDRRCEAYTSEETWLGLHEVAE
jgi:hypothetical protein